MTGSSSVSRANPLRLAGLVAALVAAALVLALGPALRMPLFDLWQRLSPRDLSDTDVRVVLIEDESVRLIGPWPWPRHHLATLTQRLKESGAKAIAFDMVFAEPDRLAPERIVESYPALIETARQQIRGQRSPDAEFAQAISGAPVVLGRMGMPVRTAKPPESDDGLPTALPPSFRRYPGVATAIPDLDFAALGHGLANAERDSDGLYRRVPLIASAGGRSSAGLALETARAAAFPGAVRVDGDRLVLQGRNIPITPRGDMLLRLGRYPPDQRIFAFELFADKPRVDVRDKVVLVGLAATGTADIAATPVQAAQFGVFIQAQAVDAILRGSGWLERPRWASNAEWGAAAVLVALALWLLPRRGRRQWIVPGAALALFAGCWLAFDRLALLLDPLPALIVSGASALVIGFASLQRTRRERERLREALVDERVAAAGTEAELEAARAIQQAMLPRPEALERLDPRVRVAAVLEPARSVGGDFYDVLALDRDRLAFAIGDVTGKGVPAALFMALSKALAKGALLREPLATLAPALQAELSRDAPEEMGLTMIIGVLDLGSGEAQLINAGHENPVLVRADGTADEVALEGGPPFCITDYPWPVETVTLRPGDTLVLLTDGVSEAQDASGRLFGRAGVAKALKGGAAGDLVLQLVDAVRTFEECTAASDDLTVLAVRYEPSFYATK